MGDGCYQASVGSLKVMRAGLDADRPIIGFPLPLVLGAKVAAALPDNFVDRVLELGLVVQRLRARIGRKAKA